MTPHSSGNEQTGILPAQSWNRLSGQDHQGSGQSLGQNPSRLESSLQVSTREGTFRTHTRDSITTPSYSPISPRDNISLSLERAEFDEVRAGARSDPQPRQTFPTPLAWKNQSGPVVWYPTPARSPQGPHKLTWYQPENVGATPSPVIPVESTPRLRFDQGPEVGVIVTGKQLSGPGGVDPGACHQIRVVTGIGEVGLLFTQTLAGIGDSKIRGRFPPFKLVGICPVGIENKLWDGIIMMFLIISDPAGPGHGTQTLTGVNGPISSRV